MSKHPNLPGIGIDEGARMEVHRYRFSVHDGQVAIYDAVRYPDKYDFLSPGATFNLGCVHVKGAC